MTTNLHYWLRATYLQGLSSNHFLQLLAKFSSLENLFKAQADDLIAAGIAKKYLPILQNPNTQLIENDLAWNSRDSHHLIAFDDVHYPGLLKQISDPPLVLYVIGDKTALTKPQIAIVGSRKASPMGLTNANQFAYYLAGYGFAITSGLALGIDGGAHRGALAAGGITIGVCGTGLDHVYPKSHRALYEEIIHKNGAIVSEFSLKTPPLAANFPQRNRIITGLSLGVLVVEAALKSGSLITAKHALDQGREVFAIPGSIHQPQSKGCHHLIRQGAKLVETASDVIEELNPLREAASFVSSVENKKKNSNSDKNKTLILNTLASEQRKLLEQIDYEPTPFDVILLRSGLTASEVSSILLLLELDGYVESTQSGFVRAA